MPLLGTTKSPTLQFSDSPRYSASQLLSNKVVTKRVTNPALLTIYAYLAPPNPEFPALARSLLSVIPVRCKYIGGGLAMLEGLSERLGRVMRLPDLFFCKLPLSTILDTPIAIPALGQRKRKRKLFRRKSTGTRAARPAVKDAPAATSSVLQGTIENGKNTKFSIDGVDFVIIQSTWVVGSATLGARARIKGQLSIEGVLMATSIVILDS